MNNRWTKHFIKIEILLLFVLCIISIYKKVNIAEETASQNNKAAKTSKESESGAETSSESGFHPDAEVESETEKKYIKWVDFKVTNEAMRAAYELDVESYGKDIHLNWVELLAYIGTRYGGEFSRYKEKDLHNLAKKLTEEGQTMEELTKDMKYYTYYREAYGAVLDGWVGEYEIQTNADTEQQVNSDLKEEILWEKKYGLKAFLPIAKGYGYSDYDDFGVSRSYGYSRPHLGHDMMGQIGTPIISVESGYVEAIGWNQYGGWRLGIRSLDKKRYYYYAHLRQNFPYNKQLKEGSLVQAGDVIGYLGHTGYSTKENVNNIDTPHLHWGLQLIFDESQKEGNGEIWVDCYEITKFLYQNRSLTRKNAETKEYYRITQFKDGAIN